MLALQPCEGVEAPLGEGAPEGANIPEEGPPPTAIPFEGPPPLEGDPMANLIAMVAALEGGGIP